MHYGVATNECAILPRQTNRHAIDNKKGRIRKEKKNKRRRKRKKKKRSEMVVSTSLMFNPRSMTCYERPHIFDLSGLGWSKASRASMVDIVPRTKQNRLRCK